jgi:hypothetical protein
MGTAILAGRDVADSDDQRMPRVAVVNEAFAARYFGTTDVVGRQFVWESVTGRTENTTIVGLAANSRWHTLREDHGVMYYVPYRQRDSASVTFAIRSSGDLSALATQVPAVVASVDANLIASSVVPFTEVVNRTLIIERLIAHVSTAFALLGLVIACIGLYGILAFAVVRRTREIGLRIALGARPWSVERLFLRESFLLLAIGFAIGLPGAYVVTRSVSSLLFGLTPGDPTTTMAALAIVTATGLAASWVPARRAARIDPLRALKVE